MTQVETFARQAHELREQGYTIEEIAKAMGHTPKAIERWIRQWGRINEALHTPQPWHAGLDRISACSRVESPRGSSLSMLGKKVSSSRESPKESACSGCQKSIAG